MLVSWIYAVIGVFLLRPTSTLSLISDPMGYLLDTNVASGARKGDRADPGLRRWLSSVSERDLYLSVLVVGEIRQGVDRLRRRDPEQASVYESWLTELRERYGERIVEVSLPDAELWGRINVPDPLPAVDSLMAAQARRRDMVVVTANERDFERTGAQILNPFEGGGQ